jgi:hypothetical protein
MSQLAIFPAKLWDRSSEKETAVRAAAICDTLPRRTTQPPGRFRGIRGGRGQRCQHEDRLAPALLGPGAQRLRVDRLAGRGSGPAAAAAHFLPAELAPQLVHEGIQSTVLVQAAPSEAEGQYLLSPAERHAFIAGEVVWLDMQLGEAAHARILAARPPSFYRLGVA